MEYCLKYTNICTKLNRVKEIQIKYIEDKGLITFLEKHSSQRVNLLINADDFSESEIKKLIAIRKTYPQYDFAVALNRYYPPLLEQLQAADLKYYVAAPCLEWETLHALLSFGVSDVNVSGPLAFELTKVKTALLFADQKVQIRVTPNMIVKTLPETPDLIGFFIRPEDVEVYEGFVDIMEFEGLELQDTFYSIYAENKRFIGNLNQCIYNFKEPVDNKGLIPLFGERRRDCGRQCLQGGRCKRCYSLASLAKPMGERAREKILETVKREQEKLQSSES